MVRYVERAGNLARLIDVNQLLLLDSEKLDSDRLEAHWKSVLMSTGEDALFGAVHDRAVSRDVVEFLTTDPRNTNSITSCIAQARENARTIRDQLSDELWEELNSLYIFSRSDEALWLIDNNPQSYFENVRRGGEAFLGTAASTHARDEAWDFMDIGRHLERADKTTRFLDIASFLPGGLEGENAGPIHWSAVLRSCGAMGAYRGKMRNEVQAERVIEFLLFSPDFPRSVRFCIDRVDACLHRISKSPRGTYTNDAECESGRLLSSLSYGNLANVMKQGLHEYLDNMQDQINKIGDVLFETYVLMSDRLPIEVKDRETRSSISPQNLWQIQQQQ